ncbi:NADH-quinone oxidoreductase subunit NuoF [Corallococcus exiguus]|uniref:NADH-quinone oxidoreductase subunit NuoF n=1 Tax=Corallococcus TaxID=83461 RepID=UPI000F873E2B|nr:MULTISPECIES: NADH-quinone oxidoreductase subunit NuoF [Corallococcus]NNC14625.1 NADH-quinone oxidoreductase subunit NuoF [Corallococcus exiguus]NRD55480.1 NADH-quinone oxidoreductase subunit NuoF [Corallococcus exiguus]RUO94122.1 NADH oxidoreductase (quinone) subunit F [Corallococcus sp. AB018]
MASTAKAVEPVISAAWGKPQSWTLDSYRSRGGYDGLKRALSMEPAAIIDEVKKSNLRGRGGAGFPTGMKWSFVPKDSPKPKYLAVNGDESEPGTFKDRYILENDPHMMLEGIAIASYALGVHTCYVYLRGEFKFQAERTQAAIDEAYKAGIFGKTMMGKDFALDCYVVRGAGAYICGEETALLESLEGKKGWPRLKPPFPAVVGLFGSPTVVNNVETLASVPPILAKGAEWYAKLGTDKSGGTHLVCLSGSVNRPGVYEVGMHTTILELIHDDQYGQGMPKGRKVKAVIPGGSSAPVLGADELDVALEFEALKMKQTMAGSGGVIVMDDATCMVRSLWRVARFYAEESCGQCTPCREGTPWQTRLLRKIEEGRAELSDIDMLSNVASSIAPYPPIGLGNTICALGDAAALPTHSFLMRFRDEFEAHVREHRCPFGDHPWGSFGDWS